MVDMSTIPLEVDVRVVEGIAVPTKWSHAPSSTGTGRSEGKVRSISQIEHRILDHFYVVTDLRAINNFQLD